METFIFALLVLAFWAVLIMGYLALIRKAKAAEYNRKVRDAEILAAAINRPRGKGGQ